MEVIGHIPEGGLGPLLQPLREGRSRGGEGALAAAHATCLVPQKPANEQQAWRLSKMQFQVSMAERVVAHPAMC